MRMKMRQHVSGRIQHLIKDKGTNLRSLSTLCLILFGILVIQMPFVSLVFLEHMERHFSFTLLSNAVMGGLIRNAIVVSVITEQGMCK